MKKVVFSLMVVVVLVAMLISAAIYFSRYINEEASNMNGLSCNNDPTGIVWIEEGERLAIKGSRWIGIRYREVDLVAFYEKLSWDGRSWDERGHAIEPRSDLTQILGQIISTRDEAAYIANEIIASEGSNNIIGGLELELMNVTHDPDRNIWIFGYGVNDINLLSSSFHVAVDGESGELIRMWVE